MLDGVGATRKRLDTVSGALETNFAGTASLPILQDVTGEAKLGLRERKKRATRAALAGAAVRLAAERGAENVTVEAISEAAGVSPRTFFNYFTSRDDAFVMIDNEVSARVRTAVLNASAELSPLEAVRETLAAELADIEKQQESWQLRARVLQCSPRLLARSLGAHMSDERGLAQAIAERLGAPPPLSGSSAGELGTSYSSFASDAERRRLMELDRELDLYPKLLAATAITAVRVALQHWSAHNPSEVRGSSEAHEPSEAHESSEEFPDVFRRVFAQLAAGLTTPTI